jgi:kynureninase
MTDRSVAEQLDRDDPLAPWREEFVIAHDGVVYLDGNSLGMTPRRTVAAIARTIDQWSGDLIASWWEHDWLNLPIVVGDEVAPVVGARPGEVAVHDSTTVCLFQLVNVAIDLLERPPDHRPTLAIEASEFPTDRYVVDGIGRLRGTVVRRGLDDLDGVDVVVRSLVDYRTSELADLAAETERAHESGALTVWDLSHAAGVVEVDLTGSGAELAAGCTYKFLNGGPGAPAFTYVRRELHDRISQPIWGWFGQVDQFAMDRDFEPRPGIGRLLNGTPGILGLVAARAGISVTRDAGIAAIATKARDLASFTAALARQLDLDVVSAPIESSSGGHVAIRHPEATRVHADLLERNIVVDKRDPDILRLGLSPLTTRFVDVVDAVMHLARIVHPG